MPKKHFIYLFLFFLITRFLILNLGLSNHGAGRLNREYDLDNEFQRYGKIGTVLHGWDSEWYLEIAENGYRNLPMDSSGNKLHLVFFPAYPTLIKLGAVLTGNSVYSALIISNLFYFLAGIMIYKLIFLKNKKLAMPTAQLLFVFPMNHIFSSIQSESVFLFLLLTSFYLMVKGRLFYAAFTGAFLGLTKHVGFLITLPLIYLSIKSFGTSIYTEKIKRILISLMPLFGFLFYFYFVYSQTGDFFAILNLEKGWDKYVDFNVFKIFAMLYLPQNGFLTIFNFTSAILMVLLAIKGSQKLGTKYLIIVIVYVLAYLFTTNEEWHLFSWPRYFSVLFPAYYYIAQKTAEVEILKYGTIIMLFVLQMTIYYFWSIGAPVPM